MRWALALFVSIVAVSASATVNDEKAVVKGVIQDVRDGSDLRGKYGEGVSEREARSLARLKGCRGSYLTKHGLGRWSVLWECPRGGVLGMFVNFKDGALASVETEALERRPNVGGAR